jgi:hypothetical protein
MRRREVISVDETAEMTGAYEAPGSNGVDRAIVNGLTDLVKRAGLISQSIADGESGSIGSFSA